MSRFRAAVGVVLLLVCGCGAGALAYVQEQRPAELSCSPDRMTYEQVGETSLVYATGCGEIVRYVAHCNGYGLCVDDNHIVVSRLIRRQASFDLRCNEDVALTRLGQDTFGATGCGRQASYTLLDCGATECTVVQNTQTQ